MWLMIWPWTWDYCYTVVINEKWLSIGSLVIYSSRFCAFAKVFGAVWPIIYPQTPWMCRLNCVNLHLCNVLLKHTHVLKRKWVAQGLRFDHHLAANVLTRFLVQKAFSTLLDLLPSPTRFGLYRVLSARTKQLFAFATLPEWHIDGFDRFVIILYLKSLRLRTRSKVMVSSSNDYDLHT